MQNQSIGRAKTGNELVQLRDFANVMGWIIFADYVDQVRRKSYDPTKFQRMFADSSQRDFDILLFWFLDHLSREGALETLHRLNRLRQAPYVCSGWQPLS